MNSKTDRVGLENDRIRAAYGERLENGVAARYSLFRPGELYMLQRRERETIRLLSRQGIRDLSDLKILEVGCGRGLRLADWARWGAKPANLAGVDLLENFVAEARTNLSGAAFAVAGGDRLPFPDGMFDIAVQLTVFTSILDPSVKRAVAAELLRVIHPGGLVLWYDFRYPNPRNKDVRPIGRAELSSLFPGCDTHLRSLTLLPPIARALAPVSFAACRVAELLPPLRSHYLAIITKRAK